MRPVYNEGDAVRVVRNLRNDGTYAGCPTGTLLVPRGTTGWVCGTGVYLQDVVIYQVHFLALGRVVGCRAEELIPATAEWVPHRFDFRDPVRSRQTLSAGGVTVVSTGEPGEIVRVVARVGGSVGRGDASGGGGQVPLYHVRFGERTFEVPETALDPAPLQSPGVAAAGRGRGGSCA